MLLVTFWDRQIRDTMHARIAYMRLKVYIWVIVRRMCTWGIIDFFPDIIT
jgi:hypothetical protein